MTPTARSLQFLRKNGYIAGVVEKWNHHTKIRQDLFGVFDIIAVSPDVPGALFVQVTSMSNRASRVDKVLARPETRTILLAGNRVAVHGWSKRGAAGARKLWTLDAFPVTLPMLPETCPHTVADQGQDLA